jgi:5'(3')-deoxyribonucleotidase
MKKTVLLDCDGVIANFVQGLHDGVASLGVELPDQSTYTEWDIFKNYTPHQLEAADLILDKTRFAENLPLYPGAQDFVKELRDRYDLLIVTSPYKRNQTWEFDRRAWLKRHFDIPPEDVIFAKKKHYIIGDILIDDSDENCFLYEEKHGITKAILMDRTWNQDGHTIARICSYENILEYLKWSW